MSLAKFLKNGNLTDFLKGELIATSPSLLPSAPISPIASPSTSRSSSPVRDLEVKTKKIIEEATKHLDETITTKIKDAGQKLNDTFTKTTNIKLDEAKKQTIMQVETTLKDALLTRTEDEVNKAKKKLDQAVTSFYNENTDKILKEEFDKFLQRPDPSAVMNIWDQEETDFDKKTFKIQYYRPYYNHSRQKLLEEFRHHWKDQPLLYKKDFYRYFAEIIINFYELYSDNKEKYKIWILKVQKFFPKLVKLQKQVTAQNMSFEFAQMLLNKHVLRIQPHDLYSEKSNEDSLNEILFSFDEKKSEESILPGWKIFNYFEG